MGIRRTVLGGVLLGGLAFAASAASQGTLRLSPGFSPDPRTVSGRSGGDVRAADRGSGCRGWISEQPNHRLELTGDSSFLRVYAEAEDDTTLVILDEDDEARCADDTFGRHPAVEGSFAAGTFRVWVGSYRRGAQQAYRLTVTSKRSERPEAAR